MITKLITEKDGEQGIDEAARLLKEGELVAIPTETVYGLAANALDGNAVKNIFAAKGRPQDNPLIVHIAETDDILRLVKNFDERARALAEAYWPGPLTMILPKSDIIPDSKCLYRRNTKRARCNLAFTIGGEAAPHLLPLTYYLLLSKNPVIDFILR